MKPWHCLVCCQGYGGSDLPHRVWSYWKNQIYSAERSWFEGDNNNLPDETFKDLSNFVGLYNEIQPTQNPPNYVIRLTEGLPLELPDEGLKHITIFREFGDFDNSLI